MVYVGQWSTLLWGLKQCRQSCIRIPAGTLLNGWGMGECCCISPFAFFG